MAVRTFCDVCEEPINTNGPYVHFECFVQTGCCESDPLDPIDMHQACYQGCQGHVVEILDVVGQNRRNGDEPNELPDVPAEVPPTGAQYRKDE